MGRLTNRDVEVMRTIGRVRVVRTTSLLGVFFSHPRVAQRRMAVLRDSRLIAGRTQNVALHAGNAGPLYWRLTRLGAELLEERWPDEAWIDSAARAARLSVRCFEHQDALASLYLRLVADKQLEEIRTKADAIVFRGDRDVALPYSTFDKQRTVYPDATVWARAGGARLFVELDRSTLSHRRVARTADAYSKAVLRGAPAQVFGDERESYLVYATKTAARRDGLAKTLRCKQRRLPVQRFITTGLIRI